MGDLKVGQTKRLIVSDGATELTPAGFVATSSDGAIAEVFERGDQVEYDILAHGPGSVTISVTGANAETGKSGSAVFVVDAADPLTVTLGDPLPAA